MLEKASMDPKVFNKLTESFQTIFKLVDELHHEQSNSDLRFKNEVGTFDKLRKTHAFIDE